jgi:hypothetical protein
MLAHVAERNAERNKREEDEEAALISQLSPSTIMSGAPGSGDAGSTYESIGSGPFRFSIPQN